METLNLSLSTTLKLTEDQKLQSGLEFIDGPIWHDACGHGLDFYVCTLEEFTRPHKPSVTMLRSDFMKRYDLYLFPQLHCGQEVCIRYGDEGNEYISPGSVADFLHNAAAPYHYNRRDIYHLAAAVMRMFGVIEWRPRQ